MVPETTKPIIAEDVVLRLAWSSRHDGALLSAPLLRDHFIGSLIPNPFRCFRFSLLGCVSVTIEVVSIRPAPGLGPSLVGSTDTSFYLLPPLPPRFRSLKVPPIINSEKEGNLGHLLNLGLGTNVDSKVISETGLSLPRCILVSSGYNVDVVQKVVRHALIACAQVLYISATAMFRTSVTSDGLLASLRSYIFAARASAPAVLLLSDIQFLFPKEDHAAAAAFVLACKETSALEGVVIIACCSPDAESVHPYVRAVVDVVLPHFGDDVSDGVVPSPHTTGQGDSAKLDGSDASLELESREAQSVRLSRQWGEIGAQLGGLAEPQRILKTVLLWRQTRSGTFTKLGAKPSTGVLLYGCPGTGKTALCRQAAAAAQFKMMSVDAAMLARGEVGASERLLQKSFKAATQSQPCVLFMDEIDALFAAGRAGCYHLTRLVAALSLLLDRLDGDVVVIGATNRPWAISKTLLRPGRFEHCVVVPLPNEVARRERREIASVYATKLMLEGSNRVCLEELAGDTAAEGLSGADIAGACRRAAMSALFRRAGIEQCDLENGFRSITRSVSKQDAERLESWHPL